MFQLLFQNSENTDSSGDEGEMIDSRAQTVISAVSMVEMVRLVPTGIFSLPEETIRIPSGKNLPI